MKKTILILFLFTVSTSMIFAQKKRKTNKYACSVTAHVGQTIPGYTTIQSRWKAGLHLGFAFNVGTEMRINEHWSMGAGLGFSGFWMDNRGPFDHYILNFASPSLTTGLQYLWRNHYDRESFVRLNGGLQVGYDRAFVEVFDGYEVHISSDQPIYYFMRPEMGFRKTTQIKSKTSRYPVQYELGSYVQHYFNGLGEVDFVEENMTTSSRPSGFTLGVFIRFLLPYSNVSTKVEAAEEYYPPVIYSPRF